MAGWMGGKSISGGQLPGKARTYPNAKVPKSLNTCGTMGEMEK